MSLGILTSSLRTLKNLNLKDVNLKDVPYDKVFGMVSSRLVDQDGDFSHIREPKTRLQLVLLSCAVCGIEFCYAAETAFVSPTLLGIGVPVVYMTLIWCLSPILGFTLVPLLGSISDRCRSKMGRRRPFILLLSVGIIIGLLLVPNGKIIGRGLGDIFEDNYVDTRVNETLSSGFEIVLNNGTTTGHEDTSSSDSPDVTSIKPTLWPETKKYSHKWSILFTILGVVLLDFSCDACQSPCRTYLLDVSVPADHPRGLATFTVMAGLGGSLGYIMGGIDWEKTKVGESLGGHIKVVFTLVLLIYLVCLSLTITSVKECPLDSLGGTGVDLQKKKKRVGGSKYRKFTNEDSDEEDSTVYQQNQRYGTHLETCAPAESADTVVSNGYQVSHENDPNRTEAPNLQCQLGDVPDILQVNGSLNTGPCDVTSRETGNATTSGHEMTERGEGIQLPSEVSLGTYLKSIVQMPKSLWILCATNLFCWMSLVCYSLYFTDFVGQSVYGGDPLARKGTTAHALYAQGVRTGSFGMSLYSISCSMYSLVIEKLVAQFGAKPVYVFSQLVYTIGAFLMAITRHPVTVVLLSPCAGVMYATLFTMPYILVAHYHSSHTFEESKLGQTRERQIRGLGTDIAIVSSMVFLAQFILSACMGSIMHACGSTSVVVAAALLSLCGSLTALKVTYLGL